MMINKEWHAKNRMSENASDEQRATWHMEHVKHCACRKPTQGIAALIRKYRRKAG